MVLEFEINKLWFVRSFIAYVGLEVTLDFNRKPAGFIRADSFLILLYLATLARDNEFKSLLDIDVDTLLLRVPQNTAFAFK